MIFLVTYWLVGLVISVCLSVWLIKKERDLGYTFLVTLSAGYIVFANILTPRMIQIDVGIEQLTIATGSLIWPFTAQLADMINEIYGRKKTVYAFLFGYIVNLLFVIFILMASKTVSQWSYEEEFFWRKYFFPSGRILFASTISFIVCSLIDIYFFSFLKNKFMAKEDNSGVKVLAYWGGLRNVTSDILNMLCDGILFSIIAFVYILPKEVLFNLIISSTVLKVTMSVIDTPLFIFFRIKTRKVIRET